ncbi:hypothetical protein CK203_057060 [Vitis vinifera]|uniref:Uncharacterized protein n=1 Tax=Vitis vinifera TaxID=29760 RepID=A0A438GNC1_VITVI|nr:hypothetical protein CK203_057060 [Vitis vinifera]
MLLVSLKYGMSSVQLFIEQTLNHYHLSNEMGHLTRLSIGDTDVDDENERDEEDDRDDAIDIDEIHLPNDDENYCQRENIDLVMVQQVVECESTRFVNLEVGDRSNNPEVEFEVENTSLVASPHGTQFNISNDNLEETFAPVSYHMPPTPQFLNMDKAINCVTEMTITVVAIQVVVAEQFGYQISYQKAMKAKRKAMTRLFGDWYKSYAELPRFFLTLEQSNPGCIMQEHGASWLASGEEFTPHIDTKIKAKVVKAGAHEASWVGLAPMRAWVESQGKPRGLVVRILEA